MTDKVRVGEAGQNVYEEGGYGTSIQGAIR